ncbi:putative phosphoenolpyruvate synthase [Leguminivora glycinivorella]|uniref:putative phosphoenolpyruvate synthase n=1 Tax=Leguminivora glycinivorella TaxID=1035111 RepID=UPI00200F6846|nr:putative phosphoenolpyruvate synthase [Leguminivora glycinivorella]
MYFFDLLLSMGLTTTRLVIYLLLFRKAPARKGPYRSPGWNYPLKLIGAWWAVRRWKSRRSAASLTEDAPLPTISPEGLDSISIRASSPQGPTVLLGMRKLSGKKPLAEITLHVKLADGSAYKLLQHPDTAVGVWEAAEGTWHAGGLKIQVLEKHFRMRIIFNGLVTKVGDNTTHHAKFNALWIAASNPVRYPEDWSNELAAEALALEPWRDGNWPNILDTWEDGSWVQWGVVQGRFQVFKQDEATTSEYLQVRGVKERSWAPHGYRGLRRTVGITVAAKDGTAVQLKAVAYKNVLTQCYSGCVRFPDFQVHSITATDFVMSDFCELPVSVPKYYTINVSTKDRDLKVVIRINSEGGQLFNGVPYQQEIVYRTLEVQINGEPGTGILELGYQPTDIREPDIRLAPARALKWLTASEVGPVSYCASFESKVASCPEYIGGKGASLSLLVSKQEEEGYKVPPGFCLTIKALEKHLESNPKLKESILDIEKAGGNYEEAHFKQTCTRAAELIAKTEITGEIKEEILKELKNLKEKALKAGLGPELRFAVRSSAVGEDSESLSAAGQNETVLGCTEEDIIRGVQKCWGSMFAFTSAYYRRQNGQQCLCGGGVVVQALVAPRAAGVMFTRHPAAGDPSRLLITANYGLGESVVSGAVEPDTITVTRGPDGDLTISSIVLGSKMSRVSAIGSGVEMQAVSEADRSVPCLGESELLKLARLGVRQEELWGAGRDIEWAVCKDGIYLLQARPITSLERWTEEELLHEMDYPIMSDDELITFANTGEVLPKALSPMSYDVMLRPLQRTIDRMNGSNQEGFDQSIVVTHSRCAMALYSSVYKRVSSEIDVGIRMMEMAVHGHKVADDHIFSVALHRRKPQWTDKPVMILTMTRDLFFTKWHMNDTIKKVDQMTIDSFKSDQPEDYLAALLDLDQDIRRFSFNHMSTSAASTASQFIAMTVLLEGGQDFTSEQCNEISVILSSGDVLSAEVPHILDRLARKLGASGKVEEFRAQKPKDALGWLEGNLPDIHKEVMEFLKKHGHRCIMEFDLVSKPWALVPDDLMEVLQNMRPPKEPVKSHAKTDAEIIAALKTPKKSITRKVLSWLLPLCRRTVRHREGTKAHLILAIHKIRLAVQRLGQLLVQRWFLPDTDLVYYFRVHELLEYIETRNPDLLKKAMQRHQHFAAWSKLRFSELNSGWLSPLPAVRPQVKAGDARLEATSVCGGETIARACVVKDLSEIGQLQQGDVLITHSTDIGWSPYFPLLTGIVTELGGLISHGAVIAREYGLPCIVGAANATDMFCTGDMVRLSGTHGVLERVTVAKENSAQVS